MQPPRYHFPPPTTHSALWNDEDSLDQIETISIHMVDAEGEVKNEELIVEGILISGNCTTFIYVFYQHYLGFLLTSKTPIITEITKPI